MSEQTPLSEEEVKEAMLTPAEVRQKLGKLAQFRQFSDMANRAKRSAERAEKKKRVLKPKPKRRPREFCTIISIAGVPVEGLEDAYQTFD